MTWPSGPTASEALSTRFSTIWRSSSGSASIATVPAAGATATWTSARTDARDRIGEIAQQRVGVEDRRHEPPAPRVGEQLAGELRHPLRGRLDALHRVAEVVGDLQVVGDRAGLGEHADEQVVEVVRDPACHQAEALVPMLRRELLLVLLRELVLGQVERVGLDQLAPVALDQRARAGW